MEHLFIAGVLGHFIGDYWLQSESMAINKSKSHIICCIHCLVYTAAVTVMVCGASKVPLPNMWIFSTIVFVTHYVADRWCLIEKFTKLFGARNLHKYIDDMQGEVFNPMHIVRGGFTTLVYAVNDNLFHILVIYFAIYRYNVFNL